MPISEIELPEYPQTRDIWEQLKNETRPIIVYGMGNGADKLFDRLAEYGKTPSDIFASDGFVRGHTFRGIRVKTLAEIKGKYTDFVVLLSFASNRTEVLDMLARLNDEVEMYIPDMPVAGVEEYFDKDFYNKNYEEILLAYNSLYDDDSKRVYAAIINYKLTGKMSYLLSAYSEKSEMYSLFPTESIQRILDVGAYNGDTIREAIKFFPNLKSATAIEPDPKTYKRLLKYVNGEDRINITPINVGAWCENREGTFQSSGNRNSSLNSTSSHEYMGEEVRLVTIDSQGLSPDYIKYDVEGAEYEALVGSKNTIETHHPALLVSAYHRSRDIFSLINYLHAAHPIYKIRLVRLNCVPAWETNLILTI